VGFTPAGQNLCDTVRKERPADAIASALKDSDGDGFPGVIDPAPFQRGYKDGENGALGGLHP
jgi:hypothetical protein